MKYLRIFEEFDTWEKITADQWYSTFTMENKPFDENEYETLLDFCFDNANYEKGEKCCIGFIPVTADELGERFNCVNCGDGICSSELGEDEYSCFEDCLQEFECADNSFPLFLPYTKTKFLPFHLITQLPHSSFLFLRVFRVFVVYSVLSSIP